LHIYDIDSDMKRKEEKKNIKISLTRMRNFISEREREIVPCKWEEFAWEN